MPKQPRLTAAEAESLLLQAGFSFSRGQGSHRIYTKGKIRVVVPFHGNKILHPKIVKQALNAINEEDFDE